MQDRRDIPSTEDILNGMVDEFGEQMNTMSSAYNHLLARLAVQQMQGVMPAEKAHSVVDVSPKKRRLIWRSFVWLRKRFRRLLAPRKHENEGGRPHVVDYVRPVASEEGDHGQ